MADDTPDNGDSPTPAAETPTQNANIPGRKGFQPGRSGNPRGRPRNPANSFQLQQMAREKSGAAIQFLSSTMLNSKVSINVRVNAAIELLNRGFGKPHQSIDQNHGVQNELAAILEQIDGRHKIRTIEGTVIGPALEAQQPLPDHGQGRSADPIPNELGTRKPDE